MHGQPMLADCHVKQASHEVIASGPEWEADLQGIVQPLPVWIKRFSRRWVRLLWLELVRTATENVQRHDQALTFSVLTLLFQFAISTMQQSRKAHTADRAALLC